MKVATPKFKVHVDALVRDGATGLPKFDDPTTTPKGVKYLLTIGDLVRMDRGLIEQLGLKSVLYAIHKDIK